MDAHEPIKSVPKKGKKKKIKCITDGKDPYHDKDVKDYCFERHIK